MHNFTSPARAPFVSVKPIEQVAVGDITRWAPEGADCAVTEVTAADFAVVYQGKTFRYFKGSRAVVVALAPVPAAPPAVPTGFKYTTSGLTPQARVVLKHMARAGSITQREALVDHSVQSLTKRISEINGIGIKVTLDRKKHPVTGQRYARYSLVNPHLVAL